MIDSFLNNCRNYTIPDPSEPTFSRFVYRQENPQLLQLKNLTKTGDATGNRIISFELSTDIPDPVIQRNSFIRINEKDAKKVRHEFVCSYVFGSKMFTSDVKLKDYKTLGDDSDRISPDYWNRSLNNGVWIEVKTKIRPDANKCREAYFKYYEAIQKRITGNESQKIFVLTVGPDSLLTNCPKRSLEFEEMSKYYAYGESLYQTLRMNGIVMDEEDEAREINLLKMLEESGSKFKSLDIKGGISSKLLNFWEKQFPSIDRLVEESISNAVKELVEDCEPVSNEQMDDMLKDSMSKLTDDEWYDGEEKTNKRIANDSTALKFPLIVIDEVNDYNYKIPAEPSVKTNHLVNIWRKAFKSSKRLFDYEITDEEINQMSTRKYTGNIRNYSGGEYLMKETEGKKEQRRNFSLSEIERLVESLKRRKTNEEIASILLKIQEMKKDLGIDDESSENKNSKDANNENDRKVDEDKTQEDNLRTAAKERSERANVDIEMSFEERLFCAERGVRGKSLKEHPVIVKKRKESKKALSWKTEVNDITKCLNDFHWWFSKESGDNGVFNEKMKRIHEETIKDELDFSSKPREFMEMFIMNYNSTRISQIVGSIDRVLEEVNVSLTQYTRKRNFILKRIKSTEVYLLIKPTRPDKKIFYSIMLPTKCIRNDRWGNVFMKPFKFDEYFSVFDFVSTDRHRLSHSLFTNEFLNLLYYHLEEIFGEDAFDFSNTTAQKHLIGSMMMCLDSKAKTVETALLSRYAYMEASKVSPVTRRPWKIISKFPTTLRGRFSLWVTKRICESINIMSKNIVLSNSPVSLYNIQGSDVIEEAMDTSYDSFKGLVSWMTMEELSTYEQALFLSYIGVTRNKDEGDEKQGFYKIFVKIVEEELKFANTRKEFLGFRDTTDLKDHEFSQSYSRMAGRKIRKHLDQKFNGNFPGWLTEQISRKFSRKRLEEFATLKASAIRPVSYHYNEQLEMNQRCRALEGIVALIRRVDLRKNRNIGFASFYHMISDLNDKMDFSEEEIKEEIEEMNLKREKIAELEKCIFSEMHVFISNSPLESFPAMIDILEKEGGVFTNLFKKQQLTGPREIFVLDILSRLCVNFVETISRIICEELPVEMLTKGTKKESTSESHHSFVQKEKKSKGFDTIITEADSVDMSTWCQGFTMPFFSSIYEGILMNQEDKKVEHGLASKAEIKDKTNYGVMKNLFMSINRVLNMMVLKKLELPKQLLDDFLKNKDTRSFSDAVNSMKSDFLGETNLGIIDELKTYLKNLTNFLQGILHYTSSMGHGGVVMLNNEITEQIGKTLVSKKFKNAAEYVKETMKVSSDDKSVLRSCIINKKKLKEKNFIEAKQLCVATMSLNSYICKHLSKLCTMTYSKIKSTFPNFSGIEEFNSVWMIGNVTLSPTVKFIYASIRPKVTSVMEDRIRLFCELRKQIVENGGSISLSSISMIMQSSTHYKMLGMNTNKWFDTFWKNLTQLKCPNLGYFPYEDFLSTGLFGYSKMIYDLMSKSIECRKSVKWIFDNEGFGLTDEGKATIKISLAIGTKGRYRKFLERLDIPWGIDKMIEKRPDLIFRNPQTVSESLYLIYKKAMNPSSAEAFSFQSPSKMSAASVYVLDKASLMFRRKHEDIWFKIWLSLNGICTIVIKELPKDDPDMSIIYQYMCPSMVQFDIINRNLNEISEMDLRWIGRRFATRRVILELGLENKRVNRSLKEILGHLWFPEIIKRSFSQHEFNYSKSFYFSSIPWLRETYEETISKENKDFKFPGVVMMGNWITSLDSSTTTVRPLTSCKRGLPFHDTVVSVIKYGYAHNKIWKGRRKFEKADNANMKTLKTVLSKFISSDECLMPDREEKCRARLKSINQVLDSNRIEDVSTIKFKSDTEVSAAMIQFAIVNESTDGLLMSKFKSQFMRCKRGTIVYFIEEQTRMKSIDENFYWTGKGTIRILIDKIVMNVFIENDSVNKVEVNHPENFSKSLFKFLRLIKKMGFVKINPSNESGRPVYTFSLNGKISRIDSNNNCPVYKKEISDSSFDSLQMKLKFKFGVFVSLVQKIRDKEITMFKFFSNSMSSASMNINYEPRFFIIDYIDDNGLDIIKEIRRIIGEDYYERYKKNKYCYSKEKYYQLINGKSIELGDIIKSVKGTITYRKIVEDDMLNLKKDFIIENEARRRWLCYSLLLRLKNNKNEDLDYIDNSFKIPLTSEVVLLYIRTTRIRLEKDNKLREESNFLQDNEGDGKLIFDSKDLEDVPDISDLQDEDYYDDENLELADNTDDTSEGHISIDEDFSTYEQAIKTGELDIKKMQEIAEVCFEMMSEVEEESSLSIIEDLLNELTIEKDEEDKRNKCLSMISMALNHQNRSLVEMCQTSIMEIFNTTRSISKISTMSFAKALAEDVKSSDSIFSRMIRGDAYEELKAIADDQEKYRSAPRIKNEAKILESSLLKYNTSFDKLLLRIQSRGISINRIIDLIRQQSLPNENLMTEVMFFMLGGGHKSLTKKMKSFKTEINELFEETQEEVPALSEEAKDLIDAEEEKISLDDIIGVDKDDPWE